MFFHFFNGQFNYTVFHIQNQIIQGRSKSFPWLTHLHKWKLKCEQARLSVLWKAALQSCLPSSSLIHGVNALYRFHQSLTYARLPSVQCIAPGRPHHSSLHTCFMDCIWRLSPSLALSFCMNINFHCHSQAPDTSNKTWQADKDFCCEDGGSDCLGHSVWTSAIHFRPLSTGMACTTLLYQL